ncbi:unnamed protein product, partial [Staurois parvus]
MRSSRAPGPPGGATCTGPFTAGGTTGLRPTRRGGRHRVTRHNRGLRVKWDGPLALGQTLDRLAGQRASGHQASGHFGSTAGHRVIWQGSGLRVNCMTAGTGSDIGIVWLDSGHHWVIPGIRSFGLTAWHRVIWQGSGLRVSTG